MKLSAISMMRLGIALLLVSALAACGSRKHITETKSATVNNNSSVKKTGFEKSNTVTQSYGDSLKGSAYVSVPAKKDTAGPGSKPNKKGKKANGKNKPALDPVLIESKGVKLKVQPIAVYNALGELTGITLDYEVIAKPVSVTSNRTIRSNETDSINNKSLNQTASTVTDKPPSLRLTWINYLYAILAIVAAILFSPYLVRWLYKIFRNGK